MKRMIVPDASVILKWAFNAQPDEQDTAKAESLLLGWVDGTYDIVLPSLWTFEVANVLGLKVPDMADALMEVFIDYRFASIEITQDLCRKAFDIMKKHDVSFYDTIYHAIALKQKGLLVTADEAYYRKVKGFGHITLLKDFSL